MVCFRLSFLSATRKLLAIIHIDYVSESQLNFDVKFYHDRAWPLRRVLAMGSNTVASRSLWPDTSILWISSTVTRDVEDTAASNCSRTFARTLLLFVFQKKAVIVVNFDVDISHVITHSRLAGHGNVSSNKSADG